MHFDIDPTTHVPIYQQLVDRLKQAIASEELRAGDQLPTVRELADELQVNFNTVARAYRVLDEQGYISTQHGRGTFILGPLSQSTRLTLRKEEMQRLARNFLSNAKSLGFSAQEAEEALTEHINEGNNRD